MNELLREISLIVDVLRGERAVAFAIVAVLVRPVFLAIGYALAGLIATGHFQYFTRLAS